MIQNTAVISGTRSRPVRVHQAAWRGGGGQVGRARPTARDPPAAQTTAARRLAPDGSSSCRPAPVVLGAEPGCDRRWILADPAEVSSGSHLIVPTVRPMLLALGPAPATVAGRVTTRTRRQLAVGSVVTLALATYGWDLAGEGWGNLYYAASVRSMDRSWSGFFFGTFDPARLVTTDKPPLAFWIQVGFVRLFGYHGWVLLAPQALEGAATVLILYLAVSRWQGHAGRHHRRRRVDGDADRGGHQPRQQPRHPAHVAVGGRGVHDHAGPCSPIGGSGWGRRVRWWPPRRWPSP